MVMINPYWKLYAKIFYIPICRNCGQVLDKDYKKRRRGKLCKKCKLEDELRIARGIDIVRVKYNSGGV
jgi:hypothetical protein